MAQKYFLMILNYTKSCLTFVGFLSKISYDLRRKKYDKVIYDKI